jgi:hypothetical protein
MMGDVITAAAGAVQTFQKAGIFSGGGYSAAPASFGSSMSNTTGLFNNYNNFGMPMQGLSGFGSQFGGGGSFNSVASDPFSSGFSSAAGDFSSISQLSTPLIN